jgi:hypothetical protein
LKAKADAERYILVDISSQIEQGLAIEKRGKMLVFRDWRHAIAAQKNAVHGRKP